MSSFHEGYDLIRSPGTPVHVSATQHQGLVPLKSVSPQKKVVLSTLLLLPLLREKETQHCFVKAATKDGPIKVVWK